MNADVSDQQLVLQILAGDPDAAAILVRRYDGALRRVLSNAGARPADLDDVLQESWMRVIRSAPAYDPSQPFTAWLFTIAMNRLRTRAARAVAHDAAHTPLDDALTLPSGDQSPVDRAEAAQRAARVRALIAELPPKLADIVLLRYFEDLSEQEIATAAGVPPGTVKSRLHNAIRRLRESAQVS